jgi:hypothetical protein
MFVTKDKERYIIDRFGLTKKQIKDMLPSEVKAYRDKVIRKEIDDLGIYRPDEDKKKIKSCAKRHR